MPAANAPLFILWHLAWTVALSVAACGVGAIFLRAIKVRSTAERLVLSLGVGFCAQSIYVFVLGMAHLLTRTWLLAGLAADWACAIFILTQWKPSFRLSRGHVVLGLVALALAIPLLLQPLYPPSDSDATAYHLAAAKLYLQHGRLFATTYLRYPVFPQFQEMLFTLALGVADDVTAHGISFVMWVATAVALIAWGERGGERPAGWLAAGLWLGSPTGLLLGSNAFVDAGLAFYAALAFLAWSALAAEGRLRWAVLAGLFAGCAAAIKYTGLFFIAALAVASWFHLPKGRRARPIAALLVTALCACGFWYLRNAILSGDAFFPFGGTLFPNRFWNADDLSRQVADLHSYSIGRRSAYDLLRLWDRLAFNQGRFVGPEDLFSPAFWIPLPILLAVRWRHPRERTLLLIALVFCIGWFFFCQSGRYLLPVLPILCLGMGSAVAALIAKLGSPARAAALAVLVAFLFALPGAWYARDRLRAKGMPPMTTEARESYLARTYPTYPAYEWINRTDGQKARVYAWRDSPLAYYADGTFLGDWFGPARYAQVESSLTDASRLHRALRDLRADYFLVPDQLGPVRIPADGPFETLFPLVYSGPGARVYRVAGEPAGIDSDGSGQR